MRRSRDEILHFLRETLSAKPEIVFAYVFGSLLESKKFRDVDVGVYVRDEIKDYFQYTLRLGVELENIPENYCKSSALNHC